MSTLGLPSPGDGLPTPFSPGASATSLPGGSQVIATSETLSDADLDQVSTALLSAAEAADRLEADTMDAILGAIEYARNVLQQCCADSLKPVQTAIAQAEKVYAGIGTSTITQALALVESATADAATAGVFTQLVQQNADVAGIDLSACSGSEWTDPSNPNCGAVIHPLLYSLSGAPGAPATQPPPMPPLSSLPGVSGGGGSYPPATGGTFTSVPPTTPSPGAPITAGMVAIGPSGTCVVNVPPCPAPVIVVPSCPPCGPGAGQADDTTATEPISLVEEGDQVGDNVPGDAPFELPIPAGELFPAAKPLQPPEGPAIAASATNWNQTTACPVAINLTAAPPAAKLSEILKQSGIINKSGGWTFLTGFLSSFADANGWDYKLARVASQSLKTILDSVVSVFDAAGQSGLNVPGCSISGATGPFLLTSIVDALEKWIGPSVPNLAQSFRYQLNAQCPFSLPTQGEINTAWLSNEINIDLWRCWTRAIGNLDGPQEKVVRAVREKPGISDWITLFLRGKLSRDELDAQLRTVGVIDQRDGNRFLELADYVPPISDIIRFMVRDVFDPEIIAKYGYSDEFESKYTKDAEALGKANGLSREAAKLYWQAHWNLPSNTQLYEMFHRLRPDNENVKNPVTRKDVEDAIRVNDMSPFWVPRLVDISYHTLGRTDARRSYMVGAISRADYVSSLRDIGFSPDDADKLSVSAFRAKQRAALREKAAREYVRFERNELDTRRELAELGYESEIVQLAITQATRTIKSDTAARCTKALRRRFFIFEADDNDVAREAKALGLSPVQAEAMITRFRCERSARGRLLPAAALCKLYSQYLIDREDFLERLAKLGYASQDAERIALSCEVGIDARAAKQSASRTRRKP